MYWSTILLNTVKRDSCVPEGTQASFRAFLKCRFSLLRAHWSFVSVCLPDTAENKVSLSSPRKELMFKDVIGKKKLHQCMCSYVLYVRVYVHEYMCVKSLQCPQLVMKDNWINNNKIRMFFNESYLLKVKKNINTHYIPIHTCKPCKLQMNI